MILVIGDIILDEYWFGSSNRLSPEAVVPVVNIEKKDMRLGGAGNVANNVQSLGNKAHLITSFGKDEKGKILSSILKKNSISYTNLSVKKKFTNSKIRIISSNDQIVRLDNDNHYKKFSNTNKKILETNIFKKINNINLIIISDYDKGLIQKEIIKILNAANKNKIPVLVDPKSNDISKYKNCSLLTPNLKELNKLVCKYEDNLNFIKKIRRVLKKNNINSILITLGKRGMHLINSKENLKLKSINQEVFDVSGAGDTVIASIAVFLNMGMSLDKAVKLSNIAAGQVVKKLGTSTTSIHSIYSQIIKNKYELKYINNKNYYMSVINSLKKDSKKIVMTNGCFDILHAGHIELLRKSKAFGDFLIVAINTDISVIKNKGNNRPINKLSERVKILSSLSFVDLILTFDSKTPISLYKLILPNILTKGKDYKVNQVVGSKEVLENGGKVKLIDIYKNLSTSRILKKKSK